ncbi:hypothetical protein BCR44DRAFT_1016411 [Catenaria anguillulae PL171]|uniref:PH domain-containing protein n=1 Tax=Catenaria anguillulae PL171 TaxID=765915 RepID=A0A1Y2HVW9_9FUNG|nr:hypothetical protein BCR44DRAFT_1016411 [Catenaria anguillulae PL171]
MEKLVAIGQRIRMRASTPKEDAIIQPHRRIIREGELTLVRIVRVGTAVGRPTRSSGSTGFGLGAAYGLAMSAYGATVSMPMSNGSSASGTGQSQPPVSPTSQAYAAAQQIASSAGAPTVGPVLMETPIHKEHHFFLFNDMLVICKRDRDGNGHQYDFVFRCNLHSRVVPASITPEGYLRVVDADSILYMTSTEPHLRAWMKDINERYSR